ncbi:MAG: branched-chain amino acid ABC transporter permease [Promethearchaeota archaeon]|jgi:branched-chain amino acid transport system permease protein
MIELTDLIETLPTRKFGNKLKGIPKYLKEWLLTFKGGVTIFCFIALLLVPVITQQVYYLEIFVIAMIFSIFAASWDFLAGFTGQVSFGHAIFFGLSAYMVSATMVFNNFTWLAALFVGISMSVIVGFIVGIICLRLKGPYLALGTMTIAIMLMNLFRIGPLKRWLWGDEGISSVPPLSTNSTINYYILLIFMVISIITMIHISKSNMGTIMKSIRDDETGSEASGINTTKYKVIAFMISSLFAGLAGGFFAMYNRSVNPLVFQPYYSFIVLIMAALGGIATVSGSALGAFTFIFLQEVLRDLGELDPTNPFLHALATPTFMFSILLIIIIRFVSEGILKTVVEKLNNLWDVLLGR